MNEKTLVQIPEMHGLDGECAVTFLNATFTTRDGTTKRYPDPLYGEWLYQQLFEKNRIFAEKKGFFFGNKRYHCPGCGEELDPDDRRVMDLEYELRLKEFPPFTVKMSLPAVKCPQCSRICGIDLEGRASRALVEAMLRAFATQNIKPGYDSK